MMSWVMGATLLPFDHVMYLKYLDQGLNSTDCQLASSIISQKCLIFEVHFKSVIIYRICSKERHTLKQAIAAPGLACYRLQDRVENEFA